MTVSSRPKYVPKGGHLVDFEKRLTPKLKRILSKEKQEGALVHNHADVQDSTCMAMVLWSGTDGVDQTAHVDDHTVKEAAKPCVASKPATAWKPPGCMKRSLWRRHTKKTTPDDVVSEEVPAVVVCPSCEELEKDKEQVNIIKAELEEKQKQIHLKMIRVESLVSKCSREKKEFEAYKENELKSIQDLKDSIKVKKKRDALASASEARGSSHHTDLARMKIQMEEYEATLTSLRDKMKLEVQKHTLDVERYRKRQKDLEEEIAMLRNSLATRQNTKNTHAMKSPATPQDTSEYVSTPLIPQETVRVVHHENNTVEKQLSNGTVQFLYDNGDVRQSYESTGTVEYFYSDIGCWDTSYPNGDHVYHFKDGRRECHCSDGTIQILLAGQKAAFSTTPDSSNMQSIPLRSLNRKILQACPVIISSTAGSLAP